MRASEREEAAQVVATVMRDLMATITIDAGRPGSMLRLAVGDILADAEALIDVGQIAAPLANVFDLARQAGASVEQMETVRTHTTALVVRTFPAWSVGNTCVRFTLVQMAMILAGMTFTSRPQVDRYLERINAAFDNSETIAANFKDQTSYQSLIALHAAVSYDLTTRERTLPTIVLYSFPRPRPSLWIANRLYGDAARNQEIVDENKPVHPAFVQSPVRALSQ
jgi:prophage DNA circulation protein